MEGGRLAAITLQPLPMLSTLWLVLRGAIGRLDGAEGVDSFAFDRLQVQRQRGATAMKVAIDGENVHLPTPLVFQNAPRPLQLAGAGGRRCAGTAMILRITDTHFGAERPQVVHGLIDWARASAGRGWWCCRATSRSVRAQRSSRRRGRSCRALCAASGIDRARDVLLLPGNHDIPLFNLLARVVDPYGGCGSQAAGPIAGSVLRTLVDKESK